MTWPRLICRFALATAAAALVALVAQWLFALRPLQLGEGDSSDLSTVLLLLVVLNLLTVVAFVTVQSRLLAALLALPRQGLVVPVTVCGPMTAMLGYVLATHWGLTTLGAVPFALGQLSLLAILRRATASSRRSSDASSHSSQ